MDSQSTTGRNIGIQGLTSVTRGQHLCVFYRTKVELLSLVIPYIMAGLWANELCVWVTTSPITEHDAMHALEAELPELPHFLATQQLEIVPYDQWYLTNGRFDAQAVQRQLVSRAESSVQRGFTGIRITGNPSFQRDKQGWAHADTYEKTVHELLRDARHFALCTYSSETCEIDRMMETLQRHGGLLMPHQRDWKLIELLLFSLPVFPFRSAGPLLHHRSIA